VAAPTNDAMFGEMPRATSQSRYCPSVVQPISNLMSDCRACDSCFIRSFIGPIEPSPNTSSVTPCFSSPIERPSAMRDVSEWLSMLMKPGAMVRPLASTSVVAVAGPSAPTAAIFWP
jgi:hypothetical protein